MTRSKRVRPGALWPGNRSKAAAQTSAQPINEFFFVLGHQPHLSLAELRMVLESEGVDAEGFRMVGEVALVRSRSPLNCSKLMGVLGGSVKAGSIVAHLSEPNMESLWDCLQAGPILEALAQSDKPVTLALSLYSNLSEQQLPMSQRRDLIEEINKRGKKFLGERDVSCRYLVWAGSRRAEPIATAQLVKTHTLESGAEICLIWGDRGLSVARTEAVQDLDAFAKRDMQKPCRRTTEGLLPPKLARLMVNFCHQPEDQLLLDPFCGSGVILLEALQLGLNFVASDIEQEACDASQANTHWLYKQGQPLPDPKKNAFYCCDARRLSTRIAPLSVDCIATEPYLGPPLKRPANPLEAAKILAGLRPLYVEALAELRILLRPGGRMCLILPRFAGPGKGYGLDIREEIELMGYRILNPLSGVGGFAEQNHLIYGRHDQRVLREIWLLESPGENSDRSRIER